MYVAHTGYNRQRNKNLQDLLLEEITLKNRMLSNDRENPFQQSNLENLMFFKGVNPSSGKHRTYVLGTERKQLINQSSWVLAQGIVQRKVRWV
jgi:hypothetical protein